MSLHDKLKKLEDNRVPHTLGEVASRHLDDIGVVQLNGNNCNGNCNDDCNGDMICGIGDGLAQAIGLQSIARDLGMTWQIDLHTDATAAIGIARRRGMGRIRHLDVTDLWIQEKLNSKLAYLHKVLGTENPADVFTK